MFKGILGGNGKKPKQDRHVRPRENPPERKKDREPRPKQEIPNREPRKERPAQNPANNIPDCKIDILKFPLFPLKWPTPEMSHQEWYNSVSLKKDDAEFIIAWWWQKVQLFFRVHDPHTLQVEEDLREAVKNVKRLRRERDAWRKEHDDVFVMYQKLKMASDKQKLEKKA
ncbi:hypothetical protein TWF225_006944 [Orbilia oligospora]|uniref:Uncharacterized protein n=1 Tax=Orbilia oligospora TaxID=2813651 RepID=A0A7C8TUR1_ORBOL|nr:hypothetical protein TWF751_008319 [Orbilia oligospora]KAF3194398.1 hypothetical protein TWF225_006944 [Orbilia oligospora]KAF3246179.1 hypothetical protein TWF128_008992 [Orbilia oligospora]KAF3264149.1 hypothetical protein TWF217_003304 [Orbilia oligospora]KAF3296099.1 hypothetical protein TWF132_011565 [Orbilia oligospora]